jgi:RNA polymerase sigma-70 factor (ECF subfamily)
MERDAHAIIADMAKGSMSAFGELYDKLVSRIFNYARTITRNSVMAEDITHDVFLQTLKHASRIGKMVDPVAYIMVATRNHSYNMLKQESRIAAMPDEVADMPAISSTYDFLLFEDAFNTLPANQREAAYLHLICGYTHKEVATIQNAPLVTVKWRYGKALAGLREYFTQNEMEESFNEHI